MIEQAFDIYKLLLAQSRTDWDFRPLAARAFDAAEVFEQEAEGRGFAAGSTASMTQESLESARQHIQSLGTTAAGDPSGVP
jgi:hypothetical protein